MMKNYSNLNKAVLCILGLGYVGLPMAEAFASTNRVIGFDIDANRISELKNNISKTNLTFTSDPKKLAEGDFILICVPTPVTMSKEPDLSSVKKAAELIGRNMKKGCTVILESTVYPGVTEEIVKPVLEKESGLKCGDDFKLGYSPERINPNDNEHTIENTTKLVSGIDEDTAYRIANLYNLIISEIYITKDIRTAEAAKVIENIQRDLNIALVNELSLIFEKMNLNTGDVLDAAATKWNFHRYSPGLVGGHCIPVDPYYLVYKARELGYHPQVILAGRAINDSMTRHVAGLLIKTLISAGIPVKNSKVLLMGLTYKEDVPDMRETPAKGIINELKEYEIEIIGCDPVMDDSDNQLSVDIVRDINRLPKVDGIILAVAHQAFKEIPLEKLKSGTGAAVLIDVRGIYNKQEAEKYGFHYRCL